MKVAVLIQDAFREANIIAETEAVTSTDSNVGLRLLNRLIKEININGEEIVLLSSQTFNLTSGSSSITLTNFIELSSVQYNLGSIWVDMSILPLKQFRREANLTNTGGFPYAGFVKRTETDIDLEVYFVPNKDYSLRVDGYKKIGSVTLNDTITGIDSFYDSLLIYKLGERLCGYYDKDIPKLLHRNYVEVKNKLKSIKPKNFKLKTTSVSYGSGNVIKVGDALTEGWRPY